LSRDTKALKPHDSDRMMCTLQRYFCALYLPLSTVGQRNMCTCMFVCFDMDHHNGWLFIKKKCTW